MIFNGFPNWFAAMIATVGIGTLIASHFLKMRKKKVVVPTTLFWRQAMETSKRNILLGSLSAIMTLLFLMAIVILMVFTMLLPAIAPLDTKIVIVDTSPATDLELAFKYARSFINQSDRCGILTVGQDVKVHANTDSPRQTALVSINEIIKSPSMYSGLVQAISEARSISQPSEIVVLTGQKVDLPEDIRVLVCPKSGSLPMRTPLKVAFPEDFQLQGTIYCQADERFEYCENVSESDIVLESLNDFSMGSVNDPGFVEMLSKRIIARAGLRHRQAVRKTNITKTNPDLFVSLGRKLEKVLYGTVLLLLLLEIYLVKKHKLI